MKHDYFLSFNINPRYSTRSTFSLVVKAFDAKLRGSKYGKQTMLDGLVTGIIALFSQNIPFIAILSAISFA
jgi:hypothetical protein